MKRVSFTSAVFLALMASMRGQQPAAPWTLVDFNDQAIGRLTLLRDLLDRLPDTQLPYPHLDWPKLTHAPLTEQFGVLKPIPSLPVPSDRAR